MKKVAVLVGGLLMAGVSVADEYKLAYSASDLNSIESVQDLHVEIVETAKSHCPSYTSTRSLADRRACVDDVVTDLVEKVDSPVLTAYHQGEVNAQVAQASN